MRAWLLVLGAVALLATGGCSAAAPSPVGSVTPRLPTASTPASAVPDDTSTATTPASSLKAPSQTPSQPEVARPLPLQGKVIVIDPGHNGRYQKSFNTKKVPAGNGKRKACNSSGTSGSGLSEHAYNWAQAKALRAELKRLGAKVILTRQDDKGLGPCVNRRAQTANDAHADLLISIHADGSLSRKARGFHVIVSTTMAGGSKLERTSREFAKAARTALEQHTGMPRSTYIGKGTALSPRSDIATLNLLKSTPGIMLEAGNMRHSTDLKLLKSEKFRSQVAEALAEASIKVLTG